MREAPIQAEIARALGCHPCLRIWRQNTGVGYPKSAWDAVRAAARQGVDAVLSAMGRQRLMFWGLKGAADLSGIMQGGQRLEIEVKQPGKKPEPAQVKFRDMIQSFGGCYLVLTSEKEAIAWAQERWPTHQWNGKRWETQSRRY